MIPRHFRLNDIIQIIEGAQRQPSPWRISYILSEPLRREPVHNASNVAREATVAGDVYQEDFSLEMLQDLQALRDVGQHSWFPQQELISCLERTTQSDLLELSKTTFDQILRSRHLYPTFIRRVLNGIYQAATRTETLVLLRKAPEETPFITGTSEEKAIIAGITRSTYRLGKTRLKHLVTPGALCEYIQLGIIDVVRIEGNYVVLEKTFPFNLIAWGAIKKAIYRDENIDKLFSTPEELEILLQQRDLEISARSLSAMNGYFQVSDHVFELYEAYECYECGGLCLLDDTLTVFVKHPDILRDSVLHEGEELPPSGYEDDDPDNGEQDEPRIYCSLCRPEGEY